MDYIFKDWEKKMSAFGRDQEVQGRHAGHAQADA